MEALSHEKHEFGKFRNRAWPHHLWPGRSPNMSANGPVALILGPCEHASLNSSILGPENQIPIKFIDL